MGARQGELMAKQYWFAGLLTNPRGNWCGRFLRPADASTADADDRALVLEWARRADRAGNELILPAEGPNGGWRSEALKDAGGITAVRLGTRLIHLDTARSTGWTFAASGADLADLGWLLNLPPASAHGGRAPYQLVRLLAEIERDADTREVESFFRADAELSYQLLRLLNSAAFAPRLPVQGLGHAITMLGRRQLRRWLHLLIYAKSGAEATHPNPLLQLAAYRGQLLEDLARHAGGTAADLDAAYMTGIFSLLDRLIPQPLAELVAGLPLPAPVAAALARGEGFFGRCLGLAVAAESGELTRAAALLGEFGVSPLQWLQIQDGAYRWAHDLAVEFTAAQ